MDFDLMQEVELTAPLLKKGHDVLVVKDVLSIAIAVHLGMRYEVPSTIRQTGIDEDIIDNLIGHQSERIVSTCNEYWGIDYDLTCERIKAVYSQRCFAILPRSSLNANLEANDLFGMFMHHHNMAASHFSDLNAEMVRTIKANPEIFETLTGRIYNVLGKLHDLKETS